MSFDDHLREHRRLAILQILARSPAGELNDAVIHSSLAHIGEPCARDQVRGDLVWLKEQDLVAVETVERFLVSTLTERGDDVAYGRVTHPGVKRPAPHG